ncbi:MAG: hypothetical protein AMJ54_10875 [Deltaproteobacteria bacterium SG8_13]|nr:MAG: hypothetical protein AMJ54_10875 [Deltaproteobacteria bacterium SG8_13]
MGFFHWFYGTGKQGIAAFDVPGKPVIEPLDAILFGPNRYRLVEAYTYKWKLLIDEAPTGDRQMIVPRNFIYDGASVPSFVSKLTGIKRDGEHRAAALLHDWIYHHKGRLPGRYYQIDFGGENGDTWTAWTRKEADRLFGRVMREYDYTRWKRMWAYRAVRWFGWLVWHNVLTPVRVVLFMLTAIVFVFIGIPFYVVADVFKKLL